MLETIVIPNLIGVTVGVLGAYLWFNHSYKNKFIHLEYKAKSKAKAIEHEASLLLLKHKSKILEDEKLLKNKEEKIREKIRLLEEKKSFLAIQENQIEILKERKNKELVMLLEKMQNIASFTQAEAKSYILKIVEEESRADVAAIVRKYEQEAKEEGEKKANYILAQATTRYAGDFAGERLINYITVPLESDKGRIIGKEGRNIKSLEMLLGVDIIVDETPGTILVSSFNLYRRAIATQVIERLIEDGRIHPGRIEDIHEKVESEFEKKTYEEGESILLELGLYPMAEELVMLLGRMKYRASFGQNALAHTLEVAKLARIMAAEMGGDEKLALRAGLLHDIGKALTQDHGGSHVEIGVELCQKHGEHSTVINAIYAHHGHEEPDSVESAAVCAADKLSAARPGARREVQENFTKRVKEIEAIALSKNSVTKAYAIHAGREIRVIVNAAEMSDSESVLLSKEIANDISDNVQYPGSIKVNVIRELRAVSYAK